MLSCNLKFVGEGHVSRRDAKAGWSILFSLQFCRQSVGHNNDDDDIIIIIIIIIIICCSWVVTRWQWLFYIYTKYEIGCY